MRQAPSTTALTRAASAAAPASTGASQQPGASVPTTHEILIEDDAARFVKRSPRTLQRFRLEGSGGPPFIKLISRRVAYLKSDLLAWLRARSVRSTAEATVRAQAEQPA